VLRGIALVLAVLAGCLHVPPAGDASKPPAVQPRRIVAHAHKPGEIYAVGEVREFAITQAGQPVARSWGRYAGRTEDGLHRFETRIELVLPGRATARSEGEILLDDRGRLVRGRERSDAAELRFERDGELLRTTDGERTDEIAYAPERTDTAFMAHTAILHEELMFALREITEGELEWRLVSLSGRPPTEWSGQVLRTTAEGERIEIETSLGERVLIVEGRIQEIIVESTDLRIVAKADPKWPEFAIAGPTRLDYTLPAGLETRELELEGGKGEPTLAGEIVMPKARTGLLPAVLFLSGAAQEDRHGFAGPPAVDLGSHEITDALAHGGVVVLRYDERGRGKSEAGDANAQAGFVDQVADAKRALAMLLVQPEVDPDRIVVVGHGEGGLRALLLARERPKDVHGIALLATPGRPYEQVLREQAKDRLADIPPEMRDQAESEQRRMIDELVKGRAPPELQPQAKWLAEIFAVNPAELVAAARVPMWLAQGGKDFEVDPIADSTALVRAAKRGRAKLVLRRYADLDHLFKSEPGTSSPARYRLVGRPVDPGFLADLVTWTKSVTKRRPAR
jgi:pimeloyl-ACP methyl ester carboxylesterase